MTITLEIHPELEAELSRQAQAEGLRVESLIVKAASKPGDAPAAAKNLLELFNPLRGLNLDFERDRDAGRPVNL